MTKVQNALIGALAVVATAGLGAGSANAATWVSQLEWAANGKNANSYGTVKLEETSATNVKVTVTLNGPAKFSDNGNHIMFGFNLFNSPESIITLDALSAVTATDVSWSTNEVADDLTPDNSEYKQPGFGYYANAFQFKNTAPQVLSGPLIFNVYNSGGITFAGAGYTVDGSGKLLTSGTGTRFYSNTSGSAPGSPTGGWWFTADTSGTIGSGYSPTGAISARDAFLQVQTAVPEPATWALLIGGFGGVGALLRRRRTFAVAA